MEPVRDKEKEPTESCKQIEEIVNNDPKIPEWAKEIEIKNRKARQAFHEKKVKDLGELYTARLKQLLEIYFNGFSVEPDENKLSFDLLEKEWKAYVQKANRVQKYIVLNVTAFETEVKRITDTEDRFKPKK